MAEGLFYLPRLSEYQPLEPELPLDHILQIADVYKENRIRNEEKISQYNELMGGLELHEKYSEGFQDFLDSTYGEADQIANQYGQDYASPLLGRQLDKLLLKKRKDPWLMEALTSTKHARSYELAIAQNPDIKPWNIRDRESYQEFLNDSEKAFRFTGMHANTEPDKWFDEKLKFLKPEERALLLDRGRYTKLKVSTKSITEKRITDAIEGSKSDFYTSEEGREIQRMIDSGALPGVNTLDEAFDMFMDNAVQRHKHLSYGESIVEDTESTRRQQFANESTRLRQSQERIDIEKKKEGPDFPFVQGPTDDFSVKVNSDDPLQVNGTIWVPNQKTTSGKKTVYMEQELVNKYKDSSNFYFLVPGEKRPLTRYQTYNNKYGDRVSFEMLGSNTYIVQNKDGSLVNKGYLKFDFSDFEDGHEEMQNDVLEELGLNPYVEGVKRRLWWDTQDSFPKNVVLGNTKGIFYIPAYAPASQEMEKTFRNAMPGFHMPQAEPTQSTNKQALPIDELRSKFKDNGNGTATYNGVTLPFNEWNSRLNGTTVEEILGK